MDKNIIIVNTNNEKEFYLGLNYSYSLKKNKVIIIDFSNVNYLTKLLSDDENEKFINDKEFFKIKSKKLLKNLDYIRINNNYSDELINFYKMKYDVLVLFLKTNNILYLNLKNVLNIFFLDEESNNIENEIIKSIKNKNEIIIILSIFDYSINSKRKTNINLLNKYEKYIYKNQIPFPTVDFYERPYIINENFFDKNLIKYFNELKK